MNVTIEIGAQHPIITASSRSADGLVRRQIFAPGEDLSGAPSAVREAAETYWTRKAIDAYLSALTESNSPTPALGSRLAELRWRRETGGLDLPGGRRIITTRESQAQIVGVLSSISLGLIQEPVEWKLSTGWVDLSADDVTAIAGAVADHVRKCFVAEREVLSQLENTADLSGFDIETAFDEAYAAA